LTGFIEEEATREAPATVGDGRVHVVEQPMIGVNFAVEHMQ